jgi:hypothetical protein
MSLKFTNNLIDHFTKAGTVTSKVFRIWGGTAPISMGDGIKFRVTKSATVDYVYVRYLAGFESYEVEFGALVGADYDVIDRVSPVTMEDLTKVISRKILNLNVVEEPTSTKPPKTKRATA